ncbi:MAG: hypothetical protein ACR2JQ_02990 [Mycobacteriales bacterium]
MAEEAGVSIGHLSEVERGRKDPPRRRSPRSAVLWARTRSTSCAPRSWELAKGPQPRLGVRCADLALAA